VEEDGCDPTSCPEKRKINIFPKRRGKSIFIARMPKDPDDEYLPKLLLT